MNLFDVATNSRGLDFNLLIESGFDVSKFILRRHAVTYVFDLTAEEPDLLAHRLELLFGYEFTYKALSLILSYKVTYKALSLVLCYEFTYEALNLFFGY